MAAAAEAAKYSSSDVVDVTPSPSDAAAAAMGYAHSKVSPRSPVPKLTYGQHVAELSGQPPIRLLSKSLPESKPSALQQNASAINRLHKSRVKRNTSPTFAPYNSDDGDWV